MDKLKDVTNWLMRGKDGRIYIVQPPNAPLVAWLIFMIMSNLATPDQLRMAFSSLSFAFLAIWSYMEITQGSSRFRRMLGAIIAVFMIYSTFK